MLCQTLPPLGGNTRLLSSIYLLYSLIYLSIHPSILIPFSSTLADYIDEVFGDKSLWPTDPYKKATAKLVLSDFGSQVSRSIK